MPGLLAAIERTERSARLRRVYRHGFGNWSVGAALESAISWMSAIQLTVHLTACHLA